MIRRSFAAAAAVALAGCMATPTPSPTLSRQDQADIARVTTYLNAIPRFEAHFTQTGAFGPGAGLVWLDRPGHLRLDYAGPGARVMIIAGGRVTILDRSNGAITTQPVSRTPLGILLTPTIALDGPVTVGSLLHQGSDLSLTLTKTGQAGQGSLALDFTDAPLALRSVTLTDPYRRTLTLFLSGIDTAPTLTPALFAPPTPAS